MLVYVIIFESNWKKIIYYFFYNFVVIIIYNKYVLNFIIEMLKYEFYKIRFSENDK